MRRAALQAITQIGIDYYNGYTIYLFGDYQRCCVYGVRFGQMESQEIKVAYPRVDADPFCRDRWCIGCVCWHEMFPSQDAA